MFTSLSRLTKKKYFNYFWKSLSTKLINLCRDFCVITFFNNISVCLSNESPLTYKHIFHNTLTLHILITFKPQKATLKTVAKTLNKFCPDIHRTNHTTPPSYFCFIVLPIHRRVNSFHMVTYASAYSKKKYIIWHYKIMPLYYAISVNKIL